MPPEPHPPLPAPSPPTPTPSPPPTPPPLPLRPPPSPSPVHRPPPPPLPLWQSTVTKSSIIGSDQVPSIPGALVTQNIVTLTVTITLSKDSPFLDCSTSSLTLMSSMISSALALDSSSGSNVNASCKYDISSPPPSSLSLNVSGRRSLHQSSSCVPTTVVAAAIKLNSPTSSEVNDTISSLYHFLGQNPPDPGTVSSKPSFGACPPDSSDGLSWIQGSTQLVVVSQTPSDSGKTQTIDPCAMSSAGNASMWIGTVTQSLNTSLTPCPAPPATSSNAFPWLYVGIGVGVVVFIIAAVLSLTILIVGYRKRSEMQEREKRKREAAAAAATTAKPTKEPKGDATNARTRQVPLVREPSQAGGMSSRPHDQSNSWIHPDGHHGIQLDLDHDCSMQTASPFASRRGSLIGGPVLDVEGRRPSFFGTRVGIEPTPSRPNSISFLSPLPVAEGMQDDEFHPASPRATAGLALPDSDDDDDMPKPAPKDMWAQARSAPVSGMGDEEWKDEAPQMKLEMAQRAKSMTGMPSDLPGPSYSGLHAERSLRGSPKAPTVPDRLGHFAQPKRSAMSMSGPAPDLKTPSMRKKGAKDKRKSILGPEGSK